MKFDPDEDAATRSFAKNGVSLDEGVSIFNYSKEGIEEILNLQPIGAKANWREGESVSG